MTKLKEVQLSAKSAEENNDYQMSVVQEIQIKAIFEQIVLTKHAQERMLERKVTFKDVEEALKNPRRIIRMDKENGKTKYKVLGFNKYPIAVCLADDCIFVITVMHKYLSTSEKKKRKAVCQNVRS